MDQALRTGVHGCVLAYHAEFTDQNGTSEAVSKASTLTEQPVIAVYGSHAEKRNDDGKKIAKQVWKDASAKSRVALGGAGLYVSAVEALQASFEPESEELVKRPLKDIWKEPFSQTVSKSRRCSDNA